MDRTIAVDRARRGSRAGLRRTGWRGGLGPLVLLATVALGLGPMTAGAALADDGDEGPARMEIQAINLRGAEQAGPYIAAIALRSAVMAACFGDNDPEKNPVAIEAFLTIGGKGKVQALSLQSAQGFDAVVDSCVMEEIRKARFPAAGTPVEMSMLLSMGPLPEEFESPRRRGR